MLLSMPNVKPSRRSRFAIIPWVRKDDYPSLVEMVRDREHFPPAYEKWRCAALEREHTIKQTRRLWGRVYLEPEQLKAWCRGRGVCLDARACQAYAEERALVFSSWKANLARPFTGVPGGEAVRV